MLSPFPRRDTQTLGKYSRPHNHRQEAHSPGRKPLSMLPLKKSGEKAEMFSTDFPLPSSRVKNESVLKSNGETSSSVGN
jgi:hypothetical protein